MDSVQLPEWASQGLRPHQTDAIEEAVQAYRNGAEVVVLDAPTGSGKTLIAECIRQRMGWAKTAYVCTDKALQDQFASDFEYATVAKGRDNYSVGGGRTAADCEGPACGLCSPNESCPYKKARQSAIEDDLACLNTSYVLSNFPYDKRFAKDGIVFDECDVLPNAILAAGEFRFGKRAAEKLGLTITGSSKKVDVRRFLSEFVERGSIHVKSIRKAKEQRAFRRKIGTAMNILKMDPNDWVRVTKGAQGGLIIKPLIIDGDSQL